MYNEKKHTINTYRQSDKNGHTLLNKHIKQKQTVTKSDTQLQKTETHW